MYLEEFISQRDVPALKELPSVHLTDGYTFRTIIEDRKLSPCPCQVFPNDELIYFFYGKPAYHPSNSRQLNPLPSHYAAGVILEPGALESVTRKRVFPFDSGAYHGGLFDNVMQNGNGRYDIEAFHVPAETQSILKLIDSFFGSNEDYFRLKPRGEIEGIDCTDFELEAYHRLIQTTDENGFDDRCAAIEIQVATEIPLDSSNVAAIIMPRDFRSNRNLLETLTEWNAREIDYMSLRLPPEQFRGLIYNEVAEFYQERDWLCYERATV